MSFDVEAARKEGYSDKEIADHLAQQNGFDIGGARGEGHSDTDIIQHLTGTTKPAVAPGQIAPGQDSAIGAGLTTAGIGALGEATAKVAPHIKPISKAVVDVVKEKLQNKPLTPPNIISGADSGFTQNYDPKVKSTAEFNQQQSQAHADLAAQREFQAKKLAHEKANPGRTLTPAGLDVPMADAKRMAEEEAKVQARIQAQANAINQAKLKKQMPAKIASGTAGRIGSYGVAGAELQQGLNKFAQGENAAGTLDVTGAGAALATPHLINKPGLPGKLGKVAGALSILAPIGAEVISGHKDGGSIQSFGLGGTVANAAANTAANAPFIAEDVVSLGKNLLKGKLWPAVQNAGSIAWDMAPINPVVAGLMALEPKEAGAGSTLDDWYYKKAEEKAYLDDLARRKELYKNVPGFFKEYQAKQFNAKPVPKFKAGKKVVEEVIGAFTGAPLKPLSRAPAKSREEIRAIAERMAPQQQGMFVQAPGKTTSVAGLTRKAYDRNQELQHDIRNAVNLNTLPELDYQKRIGDVTMMLPGDKSAVADLHSIAGIPLPQKVRLEGGAPYPIHEATRQLPADEPSRLWTSTGQVAKNYMNLGRKVGSEYGSTNILPIYASMPQGMGYSQHYADAMLRGLEPAGADLNKLTNMMRTGSFKGKTFPDFPGFGNMDQVYDLFQHNPEMRQLFTNRLQVQDVAKDVGLPPTYGLDALHAVSVPELRNIETGAGGHMIGQLNFKAPMTRSEHRGYIPDRDTGLHIPGEAIGRNKYVTPYEMQYPDLLNDIRTNPITYQSKTGKPMIVPEFGRLKMDSPRQIIDAQHADEMSMYNEEMKKLLGWKDGGSVQHFGLGGRALKSALGFAKPAAKSHSQDPNVARALEEYLKGNISQEERIAAVNKHLPLRPWTELPPAYTDEQIRMALMENKRPKALADVPAGMRVGNRLDIPAYVQNGVYVDTTHNLAGSKSPISYNRTGHLTDVQFSSKPNQAVRVGLGTKEQALTPMGAEMGGAKSPFAMIEGTNVGTSDEEVRRMMAEMLKDPNYAQIGMDPRRHSQFYDKSTGMPVWSAEEKLQSGPLILAPRRGLETTSWDDPRLNLTDFPGKKYKKGGLV
jgi:hypothetical protein